ncbi:MAG: LPS assembly protein LptD, partial [Pseudomonadota bacterium]
NLRTESDKVRGHFFSNFDYHINQHWRFGSVFRRASDRTYLRQYSSLLSDPGDELLSQHNLQGFHGRNYSWLRILHYQDLRSERSAIGTPEILPEAGFEGLGDSDQLGGRWHISGLARNYRRNNDVDVMAGSIEAGYELPVTAPYGVTINFDTRLRTDYFSTDIHRRNDRFGQPRSDQNKVRAHPLVSMDMAWPFARFGQDSRQTITPRILAVAAPKGGNIVDIPATDSLGTNLNHANLFRTVRLAGIDRVETGQRIAYGLETGHYWGNDRHLTALFGQSLSFAEDRTLKRENRFRKGRSDWFGRWNLVPDDWLEIEQNLSIDRHYERLNRVITSGQLTFDQVGPLDQVRTSLTHALYRDPLIEDAGSRRINQISWNGAVRINRFWQIDGSASHNLRSQNAQGQKQKRTLSYKARIVYEDDCLIFSSQFSRNLVNRSDLNEDYKLLFTITFKGLASFDNT